MLKEVVVVALVAASIAGCATKRNERVTELSGPEMEFCTCREIELEMAKVEQFRSQVADGAKTDWRSVAGFLGDFGIGNSMERSKAECSATQRMLALQTLEAQKRCGIVVAPPPVANPIPPQSSQEPARTPGGAIKIPIR